jgi:RHS repeat-associated protein
MPARRMTVCLGCWFVGLLAAAVAALGSVGEAGGTLSLQSGVSSDGGSSSSTAALTVPGISSLIGGAQTAAAREAELDAPEAVAERERSRTVYEGLGGAGSVALGERVFGIQDAGWSPPGSSGDGRVTGYAGEFGADETTPSGGHVLVASTVPLRSSVGSGSLAPTSLVLRERGGIFVPANPDVPVSIAGSAAGGVSLPYEISVAPVQAASSEASEVVGDKVVYPGTGVDTDYMVEPTPSGAEMSWQLLSELSSSENALRFNLPSGASLQLSKDVSGGVEVIREGQTLELIPPASAKEANGTVLPITYSLTGDILATHVKLSGSVAFPVMVDPVVIALYGAFPEATGSWQNWQFGDNCCFSSWGNSSLRGTGSSAGSYPAGDFGEWYIYAPGAGEPGGASITRVDLRGVGHNQAGESGLYATIGGNAPNPSHTFNGLNKYQTEWGVYDSSAGLSNDAMAFCADGVHGGYDGGEGEGSPLCNENYGGEYFDFANVTNGNQNYINYVEFSGANVRYLDNTQPNKVHLTNVFPGWVQHGPVAAKINGEDQGVGIKRLYVEVPPGNPSYYSAEYCNWNEGLTGCEQYATSSAISFYEFPTGIYELGVYAEDAAENVRQEEVGPNGEEQQGSHVHPKLYIDHTPPVLTAFGGSLTEVSGGRIGSGDYTLTFGAEDGSSAAPQSGVRSLSVEVDGNKVDEVTTSCPDPVGQPAEGCYALHGSWTMEGQKYGVGTHTVTVVAQDWAGNEATKLMTVAVSEGSYESVGPGSVNLKTGDYKLQATDVAVTSPNGDLTVGRTFDSRFLTAGSGGPLGPQWSLNLPDVTAEGLWRNVRPMPDGAVQATTVNGGSVTFTASGSNYVAPAGYQTLTLTEISQNPLTYQITDSSGNATIFERAGSQNQGSELFVPVTVEQASGAGGLNKMTSKFVINEEITEPKEVIAPYPSSLNCKSELVRGCRALQFKYATSTTAEGEGEEQWKEYKGRLSKVELVAWNGSEMAHTPVAEYVYDSQGRLRAEWNPKTHLKTVYGYDSEGHVTALTAPGQDTWALTYGTIAGDSSPGRLLKATQAPASSPLWNGEAVANTEAPAVSGAPVVRSRLAASTGKWNGSPVAYAYQWEECPGGGKGCMPIPGATNGNYMPSSSNVGATLYVNVTATNASGSVTVSSAKTPAVLDDETTEYSLPAGSEPNYIVLGPEQNMWFTDWGTSKVGKITPSGAITEYSLPAGSTPPGIALGPENIFWFTERGTSKIGKITTSGVITEYALPAGSEPNGIALGPENDMWYTDVGTSKIGKITTSGVITEYALPSGSAPVGITEASGGLWFVDWGTSKVGKITTSGVITEYALPAGSEPDNIALGSQSLLWFAERGTNKIGRITKQGLIAEYSLPAGSEPSGITAGPEEAMWFTDLGSSRIGQITLSGGVTEYGLPAGSGPNLITSDAEDRLWFTDWSSHRIGRMNPYPVMGESVAPQPGYTIEYGIPLSGSGTEYALGSSETASWDQSDDPEGGTAIYPPGAPQEWPASNYAQATVYYLDGAEHVVNVASPFKGISTTEYESDGNVKRTLSPDDRALALKEGSKSKEAAARLFTENKYNAEGTQLQETIGPEHKIGLPGGGEEEARKEVNYSYEEYAPKQGGPFHLVTKTTEGALPTGGGEVKDLRTVKNSYTGPEDNEDLGWDLHEPTSTTVTANGVSLTHKTTYSPTTGAETEASMPANQSEATGATYSFSFGSEGDGSGQFNHPGGVAIEPDGNLLVLDSGNDRVEEFSGKGEFIKAFGSKGSGEGQFSDPSALTVDSNGDILVADAGNDRVEEFNGQGEYKRTLEYFGKEDGERLIEPDGVAVGSSGDIWVSDTEENQLVEFNEEGQYIRTATSEELVEPENMAINSHGDVWVAAQGTSKIIEFNEKGEYQTEFATTSSGEWQSYTPYAVAIDANNDIWVGDHADSRVDEFSEKGTYIKGFERKGFGPGEFEFTYKPFGIAVEADGDILVTDPADDSVEQWFPSGTTGNQGAQRSQTIYYTTGTEASVATCQDHPEWANLPCQTQPGHQPEVEGMPELPVTTYTYNMWDEPEITKSTSGTSTRTETDAYDPAGRLTGKEMTSNVGTKLPPISYSYNSESGLLETQSTDSEGKEQAITEAHNHHGQLTAYTDATGSTTDYEYENTGNDHLTTITSPKGTDTYTYSHGTDMPETLTDPDAGEFKAAYDSEGNITTEYLPHHVQALITRNQVGEPTRLEYHETSCSENCNLYYDEALPSIHGQWASQTSTLGHDNYTYNEAGWLTQTQETPTGKGCNTRIYTYDPDGNRVGLTRRPPTASGECATGGGEAEIHHYDTADRLIDTGTTYNPFGDITSLPESDAGGSTLTSTYYTDGQLATQEQNGQTIGYTLDPARRTLETIDTGKMTSDATYNYNGPGNTPSWLAYPSGEWTREITGIDGNLVAEQHNTETPILQIANLHGDIIATMPDEAGTPKLNSTAEPTEYGVPNVPAPSPHSWLGAYAQRTELPSGVIDMGARSYIPQLGRFLQPDPQPGGSADAYAYTHGNPVNETDLSGQFTVTYGGLSVVSTGEGVSLENGIGIAAGAVMPPPVSIQAEEAFEASLQADQNTAGTEEYEEWWEEEGEYGGYEYASDHSGRKGGQEEVHVEPAILVQPLNGEAGEGEEAATLGSAVPLCKAGSEGRCARPARGGEGTCKPCSSRHHHGGGGGGGHGKPKKSCPPGYAKIPVIEVCIGWDPPEFPSQPAPGFGPNTYPYPETP